LIVVDASVAVQWIVEEPGSELSAVLLVRSDMIAQARDSLVITWDQQLVDRARSHGYGRLVSYLPLAEQ
jgi:hypothetical protein